MSNFSIHVGDDHFAHHDGSPVYCIDGEPLYHRRGEFFQRLLEELPAEDQIELWNDLEAKYG